MPVSVNGCQATAGRQNFTRHRISFGNNDKEFIIDMGPPIGRVVVGEEVQFLGYSFVAGRPSVHRADHNHFIDSGVICAVLKSFSYSAREKWSR